jgi:hypothetical protein
MNTPAKSVGRRPRVEVVGVDTGEAVKIGGGSRGCGMLEAVKFARRGSARTASWRAFARRAAVRP